MHLYSKLTEEQIKICNRNNSKARRGFKRNGYMPDPTKTYDLHHIDPNLRNNDVERYIQGNIEDLICIEHQEHTKLHKMGKSFTFEIKSQTIKQMGEDPDSYVNSLEYRQGLSELVHKNHLKENSPYNEDGKKKLSESCTKGGTAEKRAQQSAAVKAKGSDPQSKYNSENNRINRGKKQMKKVIITNGIDIIEFPNEFECGLFLGYSTKEKATNMVGGMIKNKGYITTRNSPYHGGKIIRKD